MQPAQRLPWLCNQQNRTEGCGARCVGVQLQGAAQHRWGLRRFLALGSGDGSVMVLDTAGIMNPLNAERTSTVFSARYSTALPVVLFCVYVY